MQDLQAKLEKFQLEAEDCALIGKLSGDRQKRARFAKLPLRLRVMAREVEADIKAQSEQRAA